MESSRTVKSLFGKASNAVSIDRERQHGPRHKSFAGIAAMWTAYLWNRKDTQSPLSAEDVAWMMVLLKQQRTQWGAKIEDHYLDAVGYAGVAYEVSGGEMPGAQDEQK